MTFKDCLLKCAGTPELVEQFDRLNGTQLSKLGSRSGLERMIDENTGYQNAQLEAFTTFVYEYIWIRLPRPERPGDE